MRSATSCHFVGPLTVPIKIGHVLSTMDIYWHIVSHGCYCIKYSVCFHFKIIFILHHICLRWIPRGLMCVLQHSTTVLLQCWQYKVSIAGVGSIALPNSFTAANEHLSGTYSMIVHTVNLVIS